MISTDIRLSADRSEVSIFHVKIQQQLMGDCYGLSDLYQPIQDVVVSFFYA